MINDSELTEFMHKFYGYGDFEAETWFVGMEESGGNSVEDVQNRIRTWIRRGKRILEDCAEYHKALGVDDLFDPPVSKVQSTWDWLMRAQLRSEGSPDDVSASKKMQGERWLRARSQTCAIELLPLPSPDTGTWHYARFSTDPILRDRSSYREAMLPTRISTIREAIRKHKPRSVVFYGKGYLPHWQEIAPETFKRIDGLDIAQSKDTKFISVLHPTARINGAGQKIAYWEKVGSHLMEAK